MTNLSARCNCVWLSRKSDMDAAGCCGCFWKVLQRVGDGLDVTRVIFAKS